VTGYRLMTTPDNSDVEDGRKKVDACKSQGPKGADNYGDNRKNVRGVGKKKSQRMDRHRVRGPECLGGFEEDVEKTKLLEDKFKKQMLHLQKQLGLTSQGFVLPS